LRVLSYNIHKGIGGRDRRYRLERILQVIDTVDADLVCLQEVDRGVRRSRHDDQPALLERHCRSAACMYQLNVRRKAGGYGNLILSRWPIQERHQISLRLGRRKPRGAQLAVVDTPSGPLRLVNWHLGLAQRERHWQVEHLLGHHLFRESAHFPTIVIGDTNDWRNTLGRGPFARHGFHHITSPPSRFRSFPAFLPMGSLDKAYYRGGVRVLKVAVVHTALARRASDHLPLAVDFELDGPGRRGTS
jgi:endonuclease/exonuclease/phosphatase family metal-dependent hydrolase